MKITNTSTLDLNTNEATKGCISGILHRIFHKNLNHSVFHTSDQLICDEIKQEEKKSSQSPCLVARLMGLETMPTYPYTPKEIIVRSRSTNSIETWNGFLSNKRNWYSKPRTSQSFREEPTFLRKENDEFLVLSFTPNDELVEQKSEVETESEFVGKENVVPEIKSVKPIQKEDNSRKHKERRHAQKSSTLMKQSEVSRVSNSKKKRSVCEVRNLELECSSQDSSPVSVLDRFPDIDGQNSPISEEYKKPKQERPRRKLSSSEVKRDSYPPLKSDFIKSCKEEQLKLTNVVDSNKIKSSKGKQQVFSGTWSEICHLTEQDVKKSNWDIGDVCCSKYNGKIAANFGEQLLDFLLCEVVKELSTLQYGKYEIVHL